MKRLFSFFICLLLMLDLCFLNPGRANQWKDLQRGDQAAASLFSQMESKKKEAGSHPFYQGISQESAYKETGLKGRAQTVVAKDPAAQMVMTSSDKRPQIKIDPSKDPLIVGSDKVMENPLEVIGGKGTQVVEVQQGGKTETIECEESGEDALFTCTSNLSVTIKKVLGPLTSKSFTMAGPTVYSSYKSLLGWNHEKSKHFVAYVAGAGGTALKEFVSNRTGIPAGRIQSASGTSVGDWVKVAHKKYTYTSYKFNYSYRLSKKVPEFSWEDDCARLEERADQGLCTYQSKVCTKGKKTKIIDGVSVKEDCWQYTMTYACSYPAKDDCGPLRARGCAQISSECKEKVGKACVIYRQTYQCKDLPQTTFQIQGGSTPFCMDGNCRDQSWENNDEMMSSIAQLSILKEMQGNFKNGFLFKGDDNRCSKYIVSFKDCCGSGKGWSKDIGLGGCKAEEKLLNKRRKEGLCHQVGTYCDKKVLGQCVKKKTSFCCFSSKLLKAFHEQGRAQIKMGWGKPKHPLCRGFTIEEVQKIDFSKLDLREVFEDLMKNYKPGKMGDIARQVGERLETIKKGMVPNMKQQPQQRKGGA
jgi:type-F conjugative transfer system mating-pair stabilization protein TraN